MKKFLSILFSTVIVSSCLVSCNDDGYENPMTGEETSADFVKRIEATIPDFVNEGLDTITGFVGDVTEKDFVWLETDTIGIFPKEGFQVAFPMANGAGTKTAAFNGGGWGLKASDSYSAYYPLIGQFYLDKKKIPLNMAGQIQKGNGNGDHISAYDYMAAINATVDESGGVSFDFEHLVGIIHLFLQVPAGAYKTLILETSGSFVTEATLNLTDGEVKTKKQSAIQVLNLDNIVVADGELLETYVVILPTDLTGKTLCTKLYNEEGICYSATLEGKNYEAGTFYNIGKIVEEDVLNTGLPVVIINTPDNAEITSKDIYVENAFISIINAYGEEELLEETNIKGRGNSTWGCPKKPYAIKFDKKQKVLGMPKDKSWVLLANYYDPTLIRNDLAFYMGDKMSNLDYTPHYQYINLILNGENKGLYQLGEKVKISDGRVNVGDDGFLMEIDVRAKNEDDARWFEVPHISNPVNIKDPDVEYEDADYLFAKNYVTLADEALFSNEFCNLDNGWQAYMDMDSFADWYLINEIAKNNDAVFYSSCYMNLCRNGKLKMGPIWDFDIAFGGYPWEPRASEIANVTSGFYIKNVSWYKRLFLDPAFAEKVKERFNYYFANRQKIYDRVDKNATILKEKIVKENGLWGCVCDKSASEDEVKVAYQQKVEELKKWIEARFQWMNSQINEM